jgi:hypothetical protein
MDFPDFPGLTLEEPAPAAPPPETPPADAPPADPPPAAPPAPDPLEQRLSRLEADLARERQMRTEAEGAAQYWAEHARSAPARPEPEPAAPAALPPVDPEVFAQDLSRRGPQALEGMFVSKAQYEADLARVRQDAINAAQTATQNLTGALSFDALMSREFPALQDPKSEFYQETIQQAREMAQIDPTLKNTNGLLFAAARVVKTAVEAREAAARTTTQQQQETEQQRLQRVAAQSGPTGQGGAPPPTSGAQTRVMSPLQRMFFQEMNGPDATEDEFWAAKDGTYRPQSRGGKK